MNTTTKPGVLAVLDVEIARAGYASYQAGRDLIEARATVERLADAAEAAARHFKARAKDADDAMMCLALADAAAAFRGES